MLLSSTYFGPVQWYAKICQCTGPVYIEAWESFLKQTYRNRCVIASPQGPQQLNIPVEGSSASHQLIRDIRISEHDNWRRQHWQALQTAYGDSPFFEYYQDDIRPFYEDCGPQSPFHMRYLLDFNMATTELMLRMLQHKANIQLTEQFITPESNTQEPGGNTLMPDYRYSIRPKQAPLDVAFTPREYYQVYRQRHGFLPNLSILDLLFNEGPQAILWLVR